MKMNTFAAKVSAVALCAAAFALATPAHAQWAFRNSYVDPNSGLVDNNSYVQGNANQAPDYAAGFLAATGGGNTNGGEAQEVGNYDLIETQTYVWQGAGTPDPLDYTETDTLSATANCVPGPSPGECNVSGAAGVNDTNEVASAHEDLTGQNNFPSESPAPFVHHPSQPIDTGGATAYQFDVIITALASGQAAGPAAFTAQGTAKTSFQ